MQCVILAGGCGTRMLPLTKNIPKCLININEKPFLYYQLIWMINQGVTNVLISIGHLGDQIRKYINDNKKLFPIYIDFVDEGENLLGTAGALRLAYDQDKLKDKFLLIYGDSFLPLNFKVIYDSFYREKYIGQMTIYHNMDKFDKSNIKKTKDTIFYDNEHINSNNDIFPYIDSGLTVLKKDALNNVPTNTYYKLSDLFKELSKNNLLIGYEVNQRFFEIGSFNGLNDFKKWLNEKNNNS
jgi:NDP-sugar pyrophosphorylase family protein